MELKNAYRDLLSSYDYYLPPELIAQEPVSCRADSRLLVLQGVQTLQRQFKDLPRYLHAGDLLVLNDTRVLPARLRGTRANGGAIEALLCEDLGNERWSALLRPARKAPLGSMLFFDMVKAVVEQILPGGERVLAFASSSRELMLNCGELPLPPYINRYLQQPERYQTVYARKPGAVAAPTAGLHFTTQLLDELRRQGVSIATLTLHVGPGTFQPVRSEELSLHRMPAEYYEIPLRTAQLFQMTRANGGRVVAVGTTTTRALESAVRPNGCLENLTGRTDLFIRPGYRFRACDALITNFHLPRSTLLMLVAAFAQQLGLGGLDRILAAYRQAVTQGYRFYSFGDAMALLGQE
ncbi:MAG: tRNA preQ1(34) S-adenosylmethionine ribosyltransferase-isomerase QueA [Cyanobacteria bacterium NC_groundwater_1444_Ag_S-0.65um_54_12]|nr:tRNA preQ1(34) S-adenosylmethionine ribosyltransferase-isomerase QueA [Cyanobacteria bacterium NC_groundwater_1444_Ag_S-0.65um_54_12]